MCRPSPSRPRPRPRPLPRSYASCSVEWRDGVLEVCFAVAGAFAGSSSCSNEAEGRERGVTEPTWRGSDMRPRRRRWAARVGPVGPSPTVLCPALPCPYPAVRRCVFRFAEWLDVAPLSLSLSLSSWGEDGGRMMKKKRYASMHACASHHPYNYYYCCDYCNNSNYSPFVSFLLCLFLASIAFAMSSSSSSYSTWWDCSNDLCLKDPCTKFHIPSYWLLTPLLLVF